MCRDGEGAELYVPLLGFTRLAEDDPNGGLVVRMTEQVIDGG